MVAGMNWPEPTDDQMKIHPFPAWRHKADYILRARLPEDDMPYLYEQLWGKKTDVPHVYELCCVPLFLYGLALGDILSTDETSTVIAIVKESGHKTFRVAMDCDDEALIGLFDAIVATGGLVEQYSDTLCAVDAIPDAAQQVEHLLKELETRGQIQYENGN